MQHTTLSIGRRTVTIEAEENIITCINNSNCRLFLSKKHTLTSYHITIINDQTYKVRSLKEFESQTIETMSKGNKVSLETPTFSGEIDIAKKSAKFILHYNGSELTRVLYHLIRQSMGFFLLQEHIFFVHASAVVHYNKGYLFLGESGAGKSTIAQLTNARVLSDDIVMITLHPRIELWGTPFGGDIIPCNAHVILRALFFPEQSNHTRFHKLQPIEACQRLLHHECIMMRIELHKNPTVTRTIFQHAQQLTRETPCFVMKFKKNNTFWKDITNGTL